MILVENKKSHVFGIGNLRVGGAEPSVVAFLPGVNRIERPVWDALKSNPLIQQCVEKGELEINELDTDNNQGLQNMPVREAYKVIKNTFNKNLLVEWRDADTRSVIHRYVDTQLRLINATPEREPDEPGDEE